MCECSSRGTGRARGLATPHLRGLRQARAAQVIVPVLARTPEGAKRLLSMVEARGAAAAELIGPLKRCVHRHFGAL